MYCICQYIVVGSLSICQQKIFGRYSNALLHIGCFKLSRADVVCLCECFPIHKALKGYAGKLCYSGTVILFIGSSNPADCDFFFPDSNLFGYMIGRKAVPAGIFACE
ncbi:hypothetical protein EVA_11500 [gut metagenome]|uniref:Uncharacterized protein n=1 Tax=gut metagenome TaxID=749906 RepID=J9G0N2_9ZZZZ